MTSLQDIRQDIADACRILARAGLAELFTGHVSYRLDDGRILVSEHLHGKGRGIESIEPDNVIVVDPDEGLAYADLAKEGERKPPDEIVMHTTILREHPDVRSVAHAHPIYATGLGIAGQDLLPASFDAALLDGSVPVHPAGPQLIQDESHGRELAAALGSNKGVIIQGHGVVTVGSSVAESATRMWYLERAARLQWIAAQFGEVEPFEGGLDAETFFEGSPENVLESTFEYFRQEYLTDPPE